MTIFSASERIKRFLARGWSVVIIVILIFLLLNPDILSVSFLLEKVKDNPQFVWPLYLAMLIVRVFLMLPPTPFLFLGLALFPEYRLLTVFLVMSSALLSAAFFYFFAGKMGWYNYFLKHYPKQTEHIETALHRPKAVLLIVAWSFLPIAPTDLICYAAGMARMPFRLLIIGVIVGQFPLMLLYAYLGALFF